MSDALAQKAIDAAFRVWGVDALYTPEGGAALTIRVLLRKPDQFADVSGVRHVGPSPMVEIRKSEVAQPRKGESIVIGGKSYKLGQPMQPDPRRLKWQADILPL